MRADGYHELDAVMVSVTEPHDVVTITEGDVRCTVLEGPFVEGVPADERNLARRAMNLGDGRGRLHIYKGIPHGAGLGGGSSDAAAVLRLLGADEALGAQLGADVPFCMRGGAARVRGIGDVLEPIEVPAHHVVIATPRFQCFTVEVYRAWDELGGPHHDVNDLEPAAHHVEPRLAEFKRQVEAAAGAPAILAGSGSSYAVLFADVGSGRAGAGTNRGRDRWVRSFVWPNSLRRETTAPKGGRCLLALLTTLPAGLLQKLLVLLLTHALAALLDQRAHGEERRYQNRPSGPQRAVTSARSILASPRTRSQYRGCDSGVV